MLALILTQFLVMFTDQNEYAQFSNKQSDIL